MSSLDTQRPEELGRPSEEWALAQTATVRCAFCDWTFTGEAGAGITAARTHRLEQHGIDQQPRRKAQRRRGSPIVAGLNQDVRENLLRARAEGAAQHTGRITPTSSTPNRPEETAMPQPKQWPPDKIILALQAFHEQHGRGPTSAELGTHGLPGKATVSREFGGLIPALDAARIPRPDTFQTPTPRPVSAVPDPAPRSPDQGSLVDLSLLVETYRADIARLEHQLADKRRDLHAALDDLHHAIRKAAA